MGTTEIIYHQPGWTTRCCIHAGCQDTTPPDWTDCPIHSDSGPTCDNDAPSAPRSGWRATALGPATRRAG